MSYRRAWLLIDDMNQCFRHAVVTAKPGGSQGGGAVLTEFGAELVRDYRAIETAAEVAAKKRCGGSQAALRKSRASKAAEPRRHRSAAASRESFMNIDRAR
jgi:molybdate transport system regulatory protein